jgi:FixJ family two-component response regulator/PAS domain-containing protein
MGQRVLVAIPELYAQALNVRPWTSQGDGSVANERLILPAPPELGEDVTFELALLDRMPVGLGIYDGSGRLVHANSCFEQMVTGEQLPSRATPVGRWTGYLADGRTLPMCDFPCERAMRGETVSPGTDLRHDKGDGDSRWLNVSAAPILDPASKSIVGLVLLFMDTHDRVQASSFAAEAARRFEQFAEQSSMAIWIADAGNDCFSYRNPRHLALADGTLHTSGGLDDWLGRIDETDRAEASRCYALVRSGRTERLRYRIRRPCDGGVHQIEETCFPIFDDAGNVVSIGGLATETGAETAAILYLVGDVSRPTSPLHALAGARGQRTKAFASLAQLIDVASFLSPGCVIIDLASLDEDEVASGGLDRALAEVSGAMPVVVLGLPNTAVATAVEAMRHGAADYLLSPIAEAVLAKAVRQASVRLVGPLVAAVPTLPPEDSRIARLSTREREVLAGLVGGGTNKSIARDLAISPRTVELYRARLMERMNVGSLAELLRVAHDLGS